jgi:hypothetical protein
LIPFTSSAKDDTRLNIDVILWFCSLNFDSKYTTNNAATKTNIPKNIKKDGLNKSANEGILLQKDYIN